jgi:hypothetical protein
MEASGQKNEEVSGSKGGSMKVFDFCLSWSLASVKST